MEKKTAYVVSDFLLAVIFVSLVCFHEKEPYTKEEHVPETPYRTVNYSMNPITAVASTALSFSGINYWIK